MLPEILVISGVLYGGDAARKRITPYVTKIYHYGRDIVQRRDKRRQQPQKKDLAADTDVQPKLIASVYSMAFAAAGNILYPPLTLLSLPGLLYGAKDILKSAYHAVVKEKKLNVDVPIVFLIVVCIGKGMFFICALNTFMAMYSRKLLQKVKNDSQNKIIDVFRQQPRTAWVMCNGVEVEVSVETLQQGDIVVVNAGETLPVDGEIVFGTASVDQHILTGESQPADKGVNEKVFALTLVLSGKIGIRVEKAGQETTASQIGRILNETTNCRTDMQLWAEELGDKAVLPALLLSGLSWPLLGLQGAMVILNSHPKYKATITNYIGVLHFLGIASQEGILIKDGRMLELLNKVDTVVFDKTGTLTEDQLHFVQIHRWDVYEENEILSYAALAESKQTHPIARAILREAEARKLSLEKFEEAEYKIGYGLIVKTGTGMIRVGSLRFIETEQLNIPSATREVQAFCQEHGHSLVLVAVDDMVVGGIELHATVRQEAQSVIQGLRRRNIEEIYIISGDHEAPTKNLSDSVQADRYFAQVLPENKADLIKQLQDERRTVCFIGDGINDSIALKQADVSISLRGASTVATDAAQTVLMDGSLRRLCDLFDIAEQYERNAKTTFATVLAPHCIGLGGAFFFHFNLLHSIILNHIGFALGLGIAVLPAKRKSKNSRHRLSGNYTQQDVC
ncbi:MAG: heavy metal translocating P-type ATPase [Candidatus Electrothrix sp. AU1_5]|nr:heavy metal translocating P-type ATPase [Candidatus Electrothrix gigas]